METALISVYSLALLFAGFVLLAREMYADGYEKPRNPLPSWNESLGIFLLFLALVVVLSILSANLVAIATEDWDNNALLEPWRTPLVGLASQSGMLLAVLVIFLPKCRQFFMFEGGERHFVFNPERTQPALQKITLGLCLMLAAIPMIGACKVLWDEVLKFLQDLGYQVSLEPQALLDLFRFDQPGVLALMVFLAVVVAPVVEEFVFRGVIYRYLKGVSSPRMALIISSILFSLIHSNLAAALPLFLLGMLLCRAYEKSQNILVPISMHAFFNANTIVMMFLIPHLENLPEPV